MHLHQVLTGAVNPGDNGYAVGSVGDVPFTAYGSGCDIVILANDFECVQIIPGAKHGNIQVSCVECSQQQGRIAASYGNAVCIFEPLGINSHKRNCQLKCQWLKTGQFFLSSMTYNLAWDPQGNRLLTATEYLQLWAPPSSDILEEEEEEDDVPDYQIKEDKVLPVLNDWKCIWQCKTAVSVHLMAWSPDGEYFATAGKDDCLLKVWYPMTGWKSSLLAQEREEKKKSSALVHFSFVYLAHPRAVTGFSWRNTSKYMPRGSVCNVLLTSCHDGICRLWAETLLPEDSLLGEQICETTTSSISSSSLSQSGRQKDRIQHALETIHHLKNMRKGQRRSSVLVTHTELLPDQQGTHEVQRHISHHANALCHFHIAASINPNTDIPSVLAGTAFNLDEGNGGFVVHWLNNKEFHFTSSIEVFMQHLRKLSEQQLEEDVDDEEEEEMEEKERGLHMKLDHEMSIDRESETVLLDRKIEMLLTEWNRNPDMLFTIHPIDGTFLVWHVKYLDEYNPGIFRQVQVSFSSRIPVAFPSGDASSLSKNIMMYACPTTAKDINNTAHQKTISIPNKTLEVNEPSSAQDPTNVNIISPIVMMVSKHIDGSLNQWAVTFADKSAFTTVLTVSHKFRYCGHRFHLNDLACHSVLPLLLTSSHHNALLTPELDHSWDSDKLSKIMDPVKHLKGSSRQQLRNAATRTFHDPNAIYSELILWRVDPIGPLSYTGGVSELARINSLHTSAFSNVAWLPTLIPSYCLGTYCNSASACFVASDGKNLRLYQAVVDARKLLDELSDPESSKLIGEVFNIVSQQSTARPGCIIELDAITNQCGSNTQLLHVFQEDFILGYKPHKEDGEGKETEIFFQPSQGYRPPPFSEKFYLVVIEKDSSGCSVLHMWHLHLKSVQACIAKTTEVTSSENQLTVPEQKTGDSSPDTSPGTSPMTRSSSVANLQTASKLILSSKLVYSQPLDLPFGVEVIRATPSAGHLSSSSIYPVCLAPYLVVTSCSDNKVRFWRCNVEIDLNSKDEMRETYHWRKWPLMNDEGEDNSSTVCIIGSVSGSTAKDTITAGKDGTRDYTEIDSIPPLPLYALLAADQDTTYKISEETSKVTPGSEDLTKRKPGDQYSDLFQMQSVTTDDFIDFEPEKRESKSKIINLSQYGPTYFGREHASVLSSHLMHSSLPGLTRLEQMFLVALADTVATTSTELDENRDKTYSGRDTLDECGLRYLLAMRLHTCLLTSLPPLYRVQLLHQGLSTCHFAWAFHSEAEEELINIIPAIQRGDPQWSELRAMGIGWWVRNINTLRRCIEKVAKASFQRNNDALDAALFYLAMKKKAVVWGLFRSQHDEKMTAFFSHNFSEDRWRKAALKNAFALLGKQRFEQSAAFFLLAGSLKDAIEVCLEKMEDIQLAMVIARLYESEFETSFTYTSILYEKILGCQKDGTGFSCPKLHPDPFLRSIAYWIMKNYTRALDTLLEHTPKEDDENPVIVKSCNPVVFSFYNYLRTHPLLIRRYFSSPEGTLATLGLKTEESFVDKINLIERKLFFTTANAHFKVGCPVLALEVLSKIPKVRIKLIISTTEDKSSPSPTRKNGVAEAMSDVAKTSDIAWSASSALESSTDPSAQFDWSQPALKLDDEPLTFDWGGDKDDSEEEECDDGLLMKGSKLKSENGKDEKSSDTNILQTPQEEDSDTGNTEVDVIAEQLKFRACLKILMTELRTLATGYEVDGGKLRFQLYNWLEKEIAAMHEICNHDAGGKDYCKTYTRVDSDLLDHEDVVDKPDIGSYERHQIERRRLQAKREHAERRKWWLQKNQALLRVFLSYCSLHGAQGGGLASVRMELKFLLQESQQETTVKQLQSPLPLPTTLPLLSASIASTKTVIANPVLYLNNHIHDILYTIVQMKSPPHPNVEDVKVYTLHSLAASLSASIYQALCDSHSYSSQTETNQFTGMVYQGLLLSDRRRLRTESIEEHATPNSSPAQWPGVSSLINLLNSAQDEDQPKLNILLCEAVVAVYLSLLIHALATNSCNELFRLAAHPLNSRMWAAVFGGGVKLVVKPRRQSENIPAPPVPSEEMDKHRRRFNMRMLVPGRPVKDSIVPPPVPVERPSYKEKFIPPELSMWDYFMAKPFLPLSDSGFIYDSDESIHSEEEDEDAFLSDAQIQEHKDANAYSWALLHLAMVKLALHNIKSFFPVVGLEFSDLPVTSPLGIAVIKNLENWEQFLQERMDQFEGPPPNYINTYPTDLAVGAGPAILRNKAMLEPENTPFKSKDYSALPAKRLWHFLVKQELLQETFIRYIFTKKRKQSESVEDRAEQVKQNCVAEDDKSKVEADLGYPGGKAKIIHKESDMIMAFAVNKANNNEIVLASTHDVQELDISALLAAQSFIWIGEEYDRESKSSDDIDFRGSTTTLTQSTASSFGVSQIQPSSSMPWLGSGQTSTGAGVLIKRNLNNVKRMASHPVHQYYLTGAQDGSVRMFEWMRPQQLVCFRQAGNARVTRMYFNSQGNKCGVADGEGFLSVWQVNQTASNPKPYLSWQCHSKTTSDFAFITSSSLVATSGQSNDNRNVCLWDTLVSSGNNLIHAFTCHDHGATVLQYAPKQQLLISGGRKGYICIFDIRQRQILHTFQAHESAVKALALDPSEEYFATGSAEGNMKAWRLTGYGLIHSFKNEHAKQSIFRNIGAGVMQIETVQGNRIFSCGADGTLKMRVLPNAFNIPIGIFDLL
ncbi:hypothetical protein Y1Q_0001469 [Alligator mississippiensis]|uniref:RAVE complex protein Rav1 C-terminal domain-containing protein n=1 Tax=Alligator mississippiensis TaxID=8496 RepID=A0A151M9J3_ALLMI|nr:hypothetical protein Y1Q_0001469 [Alligator mississippiensis]